MTMITVTVGGYQHRTRVPKDGDWRNAAAKCIRARYGADAEVLEWKHDGDRTYHAIVMVMVPDLGGKLEVMGGATYTEEE
jgi:hypothetical protein